MSHSHESIPSHMLPLLELEGYSPFVRGLNCFCVAAAFHFPELLSSFGSDISDNHEIAVAHLFESGRYNWNHNSLVPGSINIYLGNNSLHHNFPKNPKLILHVSVNLEGRNVFSKFGFGSSVCEVQTLRTEELSCRSQNMSLQKISLRPC